jgi:hypothetical protein
LDETEEEALVSKSLNSNYRSQGQKNIFYTQINQGGVEDFERYTAENFRSLDGSIL